MLSKLREKDGFTLIELIVVLIVIGLICAIAYPSYISYVRKSRRSDGIATLLAIQLAEEKYRASNTQYGTLGQVWSGTASTQGYYNLSIANVSATSYTLTAQAIGSQTNDAENGTSCSTLSLAVSGLSETKSPTACWQ